MRATGVGPNFARPIQTMWLTEGSKMNGRMGNGVFVEDGYLHPSAAAHSAMAWFLEDTKIVKSESPAAGVTSYVFRGADRTVTVLSPAPKHAAYAVPAGAYDLFGNPLRKGQPLEKTLVYLISHD